MSNGSNIYLGDGYLDGYHDTAATDGGTEPVGPLFSNGYSGDNTFYHSTEQQQQHLPPHPGSSDLIHLQPFFEGEQYDSSHQDAPNEGFDGTHFPDQEGLVVGAHELVPPPDNGGGGDGGYQQLDPYLPYDENEAFFQQLQLQQDTGQVNRPAQAFPVDNDQLVFPHEYDDDIFMGDAYFYDGDDGFLDNKDNGNSRANHFSRHDNKSNDGANANVNAGIDDIGEGSVLLPQVAAAVAATVVPTAMLMAQVAPAVEPAVIPNVAPTVPAIPAIEPIVVPDATPPQNPAAAAAVASPTVAAAGTVAVNGLNMKSVCHRCLERLSEMKKSGRKLCQIGASVLESNWKASGKACFGVCDEDEFCAEHGYPASVCAVSNKHEKHVVLEYHGSWIKVRLKRTFTQTSSSSSSSSSPGSEDSHVCSGSNSCCYGDYSETGYSGPECKRPNIDSVYVQDISPIRCECAERLEKLMNTPWLQGNGLVLDRVRALLETAETSCKGFCVTPYCCSLHVCPGFVFQGESAIRCQGMPHSIWRNDDFWFYNGLWFKSESECMAAM